MKNFKKKPLVNQITDFDIKLIRIFKTVVECGGFTAAESVLGMTKSAISLQMSSLEKRMNMRLCYRGRGGFNLTDEGAAVLESAEIFLASIEAFRNDINEINKDLRGDLNIGLINNLVSQPQMLITHTLRKIRQISDKININITMSTPADIENGIMDGRFHLGAAPFYNHSSGLEYQSLYSESYLLYCSNEHPLFTCKAIAIDQLKETNTIITNHRMIPEAIELHERLRCTATASDHEGIAFLILTGTYIGFLPDHYAAYWVEKNMMKPLLPETFNFKSNISLVSKKGAKHNQIIKQFLDFIEE
jgi:DNA-binding transcriptional LysR family regulator